MPTRRSVATALALSPLTLTLARAAVRAQTGLDSGALGLTREQFVAQWGPLGDQVEVPGHYLNPMYAVAAAEGSAYVAFQTINGQEIATFVEIAWEGDGAPEFETRKLVRSLIPHDARLTELYTAPPTPSGPSALVIYRYASEGMAAAYDGVFPAEIAIIAQQTWLDPTQPDNVLIRRVSVTLRERTQTTA